MQWESRRVEQFSVNENLSPLNGEDEGGWGSVGMRREFCGWFLCGWKPSCLVCDKCAELPTPPSYIMLFSIVLYLFCPINTLSCFMNGSEWHLLHPSINLCYGSTTLHDTRNSFANDQVCHLLQCQIIVTLQFTVNIMHLLSSVSYTSIFRECRRVKCMLESTICMYENIFRQVLSKLWSFSTFKDSTFVCECEPLVFMPFYHFIKLSTGTFFEYSILWLDVFLFSTYSNIHDCMCKRCVYLYLSVFGAAAGVSSSCRLSMVKKIGEKTTKKGKQHSQSKLLRHKFAKTCCRISATIITTNNNHKKRLRKICEKFPHQHLINISHRWW